MFDRSGDMVTFPFPFSASARFSSSSLIDGSASDGPMSDSACYEMENFMFDHR